MRVFPVITNSNDPPVSWLLCLIYLYSHRVCVCVCVCVGVCECAYIAQCVPLCSVVILHCILRTGMFFATITLTSFSSNEVEAGRRRGMDKYKRWERNAKEMWIDYTRMKGIKDRNGGKKEEGYGQGLVRGFSLNFQRALLEQVEENASWEIDGNVLIDEMWRHFDE